MNPLVYRHVIAGQLVTASPLAIHSGKSYEADPTPFRSNAFRDKDNCDQLILRDYAGRPYIPGSSIKGILRSVITRMEGADIADVIFGVDATSEDASRGGCVIFEDAFVDDGRAWKILPNQDAKLCDAYASWLDELASELGVSSTSSFAKVARDFPSNDSFASGAWRTSRNVPPLHEVLHLPFWMAEYLTYVEQHVSINRRTGTASDHMLFDSEAVPAGLPFHVCCIVGHPNNFTDVKVSGISQQEITRVLLRGLAAFNLEPVHCPPQLGSCANIGWGMMNWNVHRTRVYSQFPDKTVVESKFAGKELVDVQLSVFDKPPLACLPCIQVELELAMRGQFLVNDESLVLDKDARPERKTNSDPENEYDHYPRMLAGGQVENNRPSRGRALLPGSSAKGVVRSHLERIFNTIHDSDSVGVAPHRQRQEIDGNSPEFLKYLFGMEDRASGLWVSDFAAPELSNVCKQEMVAIDRWTGGVAIGAKFDAGFFESPRLRGIIRVTLPPSDKGEIKREQHRIIGLAALLLSDLLVGDIAFGFGSGKGYGACDVILRNMQFRGCRLQLPLANEDVQDEPLTSLQDAELRTLFLAVAAGDEVAIEKANILINAMLKELREGVR